MRFFERAYDEIHFFGCKGTNAPLRAMSSNDEVREISRQIHNLARRRKRAIVSAEPSCRDGEARVSSQISAVQSRQSLMVYVLAGHSAAVAVDFMLGRGRPWNRRRCKAAVSIDAEKLRADVEQAFLDAPTSALSMLVLDPLNHFEFDDLLCANKYLMEHRLYNWIYAQNHEHGVAPSRAQIIAQALFCIPAQAPERVKDLLSGCLTGAPRKQRRWLARFRARWGARVGVLRSQEDLPVAVRKQKVGVCQTPVVEVFFLGGIHVSRVFPPSIFGSAVLEFSRSRTEKEGTLWGRQVGPFLGPPTTLILMLARPLLIFNGSTQRWVRLLHPGRPC